MRLDKIYDPRNPIMRMSRKELEYLARYERRDDISPDMPGDLMRARFLNRPPARMPRPMGPSLGAYKRFVIPPYEEWIRAAFGDAQASVQAQPEVDALADLERQYMAQRSPAEMTIQEARKACKARGIKTSRTDKLDTLRAKLDGEDPAQRGQ